MQDIKTGDRKNGPASQAILKAMRIRRYDAKHIAQYGRSRATLDATECGHWQLFTPYCPGGCHGSHGHQFLHNKSSCGIVVITFQS
jgi:hypothetical protein